MDGVDPSVIWGLGSGLLGAVIIVLYTRANHQARLRSGLAHWLVGWLTASAGMALMGTSWGLLFFSPPQYHSLLSTVLGALLCALSLGTYVLSARWVGRWKRPSNYTLALSTNGIYSRVRHPQALALCILPFGMGLLGGSVPLLLTAPLWAAFWTAYTYLEEKNELLPAFGEAYRRYQASTPRLVPRLGRRRKRRTTAAKRERAGQP